MARATTPTTKPTPSKSAAPQPMDVRGQEDFARRLRKAMAKKGMSQSDLAAAVWGQREAIYPDGRQYTVAKNREQVSCYWHGKAIPRAGTLKKLADALGTTPAELAPMAAQNHVPPEVSFEVLGGGQAMLRVATVVSPDLAMKIARMIQSERGDHGARG
jgi:transcriptional regulator with XRE-family HTH domain